MASSRSRSLLALLLLALAACASPSPGRGTDQDAPSDALGSVRDESGRLVPAVAGSPRERMYQLVESGPSLRTRVIESMVASADEAYIPVLIEAYRALQIGLVGGSPAQYVDALHALSGEQFGLNWADWVIWYGATDIVPPDGFAGWKGRLLAGLDSGFALFLRDGVPSRIRVEEILWGGVQIDGIPPLESAPMIAGTDADYLLPNEPVFGIEINGDARAYPLRIMDNHEMANDTVGGVPISLAYCTLCGAAIAYDGRASNGETYRFGTSGFLYRSNKLMYDRQTLTLWNQLTGRPVFGELADTDVFLPVIPTVLSSWADWIERHPDTLVLDRNTGVYPSSFYTPGILYGGYFASPDTMFPVWTDDDRLAEKDFIYAMFVDGVPRAYDVAALVDAIVVNDRVGQTDVVLIAPSGTSQVRGQDRRVGEVVYTNGAEVRAYVRGGYTFSAGSRPDVLVSEDGRAWAVTEGFLVAENDEELPRLPGHLAYWFGWFSFFPETEVYTGG